MCDLVIITLCHKFYSKKGAFLYKYQVIMIALDVFCRSNISPISHKKWTIRDYLTISSQNIILSRCYFSIIFFEKCFVFLSYSLRIEERLLVVLSVLQRSWALKPWLCVMRAISMQIIFKKYLIVFIIFFCRQMKRFVFLLEPMFFSIWRILFILQRIIMLMYAIFSCFILGNSSWLWFSLRKPSFFWVMWEQWNQICRTFF